jgi:hypothetical protein
MRRLILLAIGFVILGSSMSSAVALKDCSKGTTNARLACMQKNTVLLNSSYQMVTAKHRKEIADLKARVTVLTRKLEAADLSNVVHKADISDVIRKADLSNVVRRDQPFKLGFDKNRCLIGPSGVSGLLVGPSPQIIDAQVLTLLIDCNSAPQMFFYP